jgi:hypothetical protein
MEIRDHKNKLLAIILRDENFREGKYFATENSAELQLASFNLEKDTVIEKHYHPEQKRFISTTSEVIVVIQGKIEIEIFNNNLEILHTDTILAGDVLALYSGGHGLKLSEDSKFIEVKQGPFIPEIDKKRF